MRYQEIVFLRQDWDFAGFAGIVDPEQAQRAFFDAEIDDQFEYLLNWDYGDDTRIVDDLALEDRYATTHYKYILDVNNRYRMDLNRALGSASLVRQLSDTDD